MFKFITKLFSVSTKSDNELWDSLTDDDRTILDIISGGGSYLDVARIFGLRYDLARLRIKSIFDKMNCIHREDVILKYIQLRKTRK